MAIEYRDEINRLISKVEHEKKLGKKLYAILQLNALVSSK